MKGIKMIRSKHNNLLNYFICNREDLSKEYVRKSEKFLKEISDKLKKEKGFNYKGQFITNPFISPCGRFDVNPKKYYGLTKEEVKQIKEESK